MKYDAIIIGFGKAGKTLAGALAKQGRQVALVERSRAMYGGTCINVGCIPSKSLVTSAAEAALHADEPFEAKAERYAAAIAEKRRVTGLLRGKNYGKLHDLPGVAIYDGFGRFLSSNQVEVALTDGGTTVLEGEKIFINTGSVPIVREIPGLQGNPRAYTSETLMDEERLPRRLTLIGAGYIGMEFASLYTNFGAQVTVLQDGGTFLPKEDRDVAEEIRSVLEKRGVRFLLGAKTLRADGGTVVYEQDGAEHTLPGDAILLATGRRPNTDGLQAEKAGVALTARGAVQVDALLRTTAPNIWAMGDVNGGPQFTFVSLDDFRIVLSQLTGGSRSRDDRSSVPYSVFMDTPLSRVGLTEREAAEQNIPVRILKLPAAAIPKAQVLRKTDGFLKAVVHAETGKILGAALLCPESYEMINLVKLAMDLDADYTVLRDRIYTHPTMTEAFNDLFAL
ncbi:MAG: FAD-dependent oxidoreductase [Oscillibacter sp.]|jgi:pyruvate/2-oxoglutarate dehydrogenase complex dihydrolipoamide dehydrogenase (E3) component|nr:FAD-dependent oxidoreductase [Oscillibacter sp.]